MELEVLKKKLSTFRTKEGHLRKVNDDLLAEILNAWENWTGTPKSFYTGIGINGKKMAAIIGKAKKLKRKGYMAGEFREVKIETAVPSHGDYSVELVWEGGRIIRFGGVDLVVDFLRKVG